MPERSPGTDLGILRGAAPVQDWSLDALKKTLRDVTRQIRDQERVFCVHPDDLSDELRGLIDADPFSTIRETNMVERGQVFVLRPGFIYDL